MSETKISRGQVIAAFRAFLAQRVYVSHPHPDVIRAALEMIEGDGWIRVEDRMPAETHSIFWPLSGTDKWDHNMWREESDTVLVTVTFKDGRRFVTTGQTQDGVWRTRISRALDPVVTHWMQMPEPPED